jgi:hypothetical protein
MLGKLLSMAQPNVVKTEGGVADQHFANTDAPSAEIALERAIERLANYARAQHLTELDELLTELMAALFASRKVPTGKGTHRAGRGYQ